MTTAKTVGKLTLVGLIGAIIGGHYLVDKMPASLPAIFASGPSLKVWIQESQESPRDDRLVSLNIQSRDEKPFGVTGVLMNDNPSCIKFSLYQWGTPVKLGEVINFYVGVVDQTACEPVKVVISTDRGEVIYHFE